MTNPGELRHAEKLIDAQPVFTTVGILMPLFCKPKGLNINWHDRPTG